MNSTVVGPVHTTEFLELRPAGGYRRCPLQRRSRSTSARSSRGGRPRALRGRDEARRAQAREVGLEPVRTPPGLPCLPGFPRWRSPRGGHRSPITFIVVTRRGSHARFSRCWQNLTRNWAWVRAAPRRRGTVRGSSPSCRRVTLAALVVVMSARSRSPTGSWRSSRRSRCTTGQTVRSLVVVGLLGVV